MIDAKKTFLEITKSDFLEKEIAAWIEKSQASQEALNEMLRLSAAHDAVKIVIPLIMAGANPYDADEKGMTAFNRAANNGLQALAWLTEEAFRDTQRSGEPRRWEGYDLNTPFGYYGSTLITYAAKVCPVAVVKEMISAGADTGIINDSGWTLLHCAAVMPNRYEVLVELMRSFVEVDRFDLIEALSTHLYETDYDGHAVVYAAGLTATRLCQARLAQDPHCPAELSEYVKVLAQTNDRARSAQAGKA